MWPKFEALEAARLMAAKESEGYVRRVAEALGRVHPMPGSLATLTLQEGE